MKFKTRNLRAVAEMVIGDANHFPYRSSSYITQFFEEYDLDFVHDGSTRWAWTSTRLAELLEEPQPKAHALPDRFVNVLRVLMQKSDAEDNDPGRLLALEALNKPLEREGFEAFYGEDTHLYIRHIGTKTLSTSANPRRPFTPNETKRRDQLNEYLDVCSEDDLIAAVNANIAEIHNQALMMLGHELFDPETSKKVLVDHAFIVAGGEITKQARNWLGGKLDASKRSQILFMDREDILNLYIVSTLPLPDGATLKPASSPFDDDIPF